VRNSTNQIITSKVRSRYKRDKTYSKPLQLTQRDIDILKAVSDYRILTAYQIGKLFFSSLHKARKRLFRLWQHHFLDRRFQPVRLGEGASQVLYTLSRTGAQLLATRNGTTTGGRAPVPFTSRGSALYVDHTLKLNDFRVALMMACNNRSDTKLLFWKQGNSIKQTVNFVNGVGQKTLHRVTVLADGFFGIEHNGMRRNYFVEIDRGTIGNRRMLTRMKGYYHLWLQRQRLHQLQTNSFRVLVVTTSTARMENLIRTARQVRNGNGGANLFWFTTFNQYDLGQPQSILAPIWKRSVPEEDTRFSLLGRPA
jgi:hypothetical protein